jgi:hypothetical protein
MPDQSPRQRILTACQLSQAQAGPASSHQDTHSCPRKGALMPRPDAHRTIYATYRSRSRLARIRLRRPGTRLLAIELLNSTGELPAGKHALHIILAEHRRALHDLATSALAGQQAGAR